MADEKTIKFTADQRYDEIPPKFFKAGDTHTMRADLADRWITRGSAVEVEPNTGKVKPVVAREQPKLAIGPALSSGPTGPAVPPPPPVKTDNNN